jgi:MbtH protein
VSIDSDGTIFQVVVNDEAQFSIWPADREIPLGWHASGPQAIKKECLDYIEENWTDMRPLSVRRQLDEH